ncbi:MAG: hypothetical protein RL172_1637 [Bacteroidota bacterium]
MRKLLLIITWVMCTVLLQAQTFSAGGGSIPATSTTQTCFNLAVTGVGAINSTSYGLSGVCININHPYVEELEIVLKGPDGTVVPLSIQNGGAGNNYTNTCFSATATNSVKFAAAPFTGSYLPEGYLGGVNNGQNANGTWSLCIQDRRNGGNSGSLVNWNLSFGSNPAPAPPAFPSVCSANLPATSTCAGATAVCDFNGLCGSTTGTTVQDWAGSGLDGCFGLQNNTFIKFEADSTVATFTVWVPTTSAGPTGGIQMLFFSGTCNSGAVTPHGCYPHIFPYQSAGSPVSTLIRAEGLVKGNVYYLMIDGFNNDNCTFSIAASSGVKFVRINPDVAAICNGNSTTLTATGGNGTFSWAPALGLSAVTGASVTANPSVTTQYTATSQNSVGCTLTDTATVFVNDKPVITAHPALDTQRVCQNGTVNPLSVAAMAGSGSITGYQWFLSLTPVNSGGTLLPFATGAVFTPSSSNSPDTFYFYCRVTNSNGCTTVSNISGPLIILPLVATPAASVTVQPITCTLPTGTIVVNSPVGVNIEYSVGGAYQSSPVFSGLAPGNYTVTARNIVTGCISQAVALTVNAPPAAPPTPVASVTVQPSCVVPTGTIVITSPAGPVFEYSIGGAYQLSNTFTGLLNGTTYTITARDIVTGCISNPVTLSVNTIPGAPSSPSAFISTQPDCNTATGAITVTAPTGVNYEYSIGGAYQAGTVFSGLAPNTTYAVTVRVVSSGCVSPPANLTTNAIIIPAAPGVLSPIGYCQNAISVPLTATGSNLLWYTTATGGTGSATPPTPSTASTGSTTYYVSEVSGSCESARSAIVVNVSAQPAAPVVSSPVNYCQNQSSSALTATGTNLLWYIAATGGTGSATAPVPVTTTAGTVSYYVSQNVGGCESPRALITVNTAASPNAPLVNAAIGYCQNAAASPLAATGSNLLWYTAATGGTGSNIAPVPITSTAGNTSYYVSQTIGSCESPRAVIIVTVSAVPAAPTVSSPVIYCQGSTATALTATGTNLLWYTTATGGTGNSVAPVPSTTALGNTIYYVSQSVAGCESSRSAITVTINAGAAAPGVVSPVTYCQFNSAVPLTATGANLLWYSSATGGLGSTTAPIPSTILPGNTFYYVSQTPAGNCESIRSAITVTVNKDSMAVTGFSYNPSTVCINGINPGPALQTGFTSGGRFTSTTGLSINSATGNINLSASRAGTYIVTYTFDSTACIRGGSSSATLVINPAVTAVTVFSYSSPVCINAAVNPVPNTIAGFTTGGSFSSSQGLSVNAATGEIDLSTSRPGTYQVTYSLPALGCRLPTSSFSFITIFDTTRPVTRFTYNPSTVCITTGTNPGIVKAPGFTNGGSFTVTPSGLNINPSTGNINIGLSVPGTYTIRYSVAAFLCRLAGEDSTTFTITAYGDPVTGFSYLSPVCKSDDSAHAILDANFTSGGLFTSSAGLDINPVSGTIDLAKSLAGNYLVQYSVAAGACNPAGSSNSTIIILQQPEGPEAPFTSICGPGDIVLSATGSGIIKWYRDETLANQVNVGNTYSLFLNSTTQYYLTNTVGSCASEPVMLTAMVSPVPDKPFLGNDTGICPTEQIILNPGLYNSYLWQDGSIAPVYNATQAGLYKVIVSNGAGCKDSASITIAVLDNCDDLLFPSAFTPDGNSLNDQFGPLGAVSLITDYSLRIFNRYGQVIFSSNNPSVKWDGTFKGKLVNTGNYVYVATYSFRDRIVRTKKGSVVVIK